ncbi:MAG: helix-turn-helix domain-containing protein [Propylenella sp.]
MGVQFITAPGGARLVVIPEAEYRALAEAAEDSADRAAVRRFRKALAAGEEELVPSDVVNRILDGDNPIRVWRRHRGMTINELAEKVGIASAYLSQMETGKREGTVSTLRRIATTLGIALDDLIPG